MQKFLQSGVLTLSLLSASVHAPQAKACGVFTSPVGGGLIAAGICLIVFSETTAAVGALTGAGVGAGIGALTGAPAGAAPEGAAVGATIGAWVLGLGSGIASIVCGILLLEDKNGNKDFKFTKIDKKYAHSIGIDSDQADLYNESLLELNAIKETVTGMLSEIAEDRALTEEDSMNAWTSVIDDIRLLGISPETLARLLHPAKI